MVYFFALFYTLYTKVPCLLERSMIEKHNLFSGMFNSHYISSTRRRELLLCMNVSQPRRKTMVHQPEQDKQTPAANCSPEVAEAGYKRRKITVRPYVRRAFYTLYKSFRLHQLIWSSHLACEMGVCFLILINEETGIRKVR